MTTPEGKVKDLIKELLLKYKIYPAAQAGAFPDGVQGWVYMPIKGSAFGVAGVPDFIGNYKGIFWSIEAKAPGKEPTGFQALQIAAIRKAGSVCFVVDGEESLKGFERWLEQTYYAVEGAIF